MSASLWSLVAEKLNEHDYMTGVERTVERVYSTGEIFTPSSLVIEILSGCDINIMAPGRTILDPACGDGQFLCAAKWVKILHFEMCESDALAEIYGVDIMRDNVDLCFRRLGGGTILMGDTLKPSRRLEGQRESEWLKMRELFEDCTTTTYKRKGVLKRRGDDQSVGSAESRNNFTGQSALF